MRDPIHQQKHHRHTALRAASALAIVALSGADALAIDREVKAYFVDDFDGAGACGGNDLSWGYDSADYLRDLALQWNWSSSLLYGDLLTDFEDVADVDEDPDGADHNTSRGFDEADVAMLYSKGGYGGCSAGTAFSSFMMGDNSGECSVTYGTANSDNDVHWGDLDLNIVIIDTPNSLRKCVAMEPSYYGGENNFSLYLGYHGIVWDSSSHTNRFEDYVDCSELDGAGDNWVDLMTSRPIGWDNDECATAIAYGVTEADADYIYDYTGLADWKVPTTNSASWFYSIGGCNASGAEVL